MTDKRSFAPRRKGARVYLTNNELDMLAELLGACLDPYESVSREYGKGAGYRAKEVQSLCRKVDGIRRRQWVKAAK